MGEAEIDADMSVTMKIMMMKDQEIVHQLKQPQHQLKALGQNGNQGNHQKQPPKPLLQPLPQPLKKQPKEQELLSQLEQILHYPAMFISCQYQQSLLCIGSYCDMCNCKLLLVLTCIVQKFKKKITF